jgi:uncharacterized repeat protein (TIGR01451 family)
MNAHTTTTSRGAWRPVRREPRARRGRFAMLVLGIAVALFPTLEHQLEQPTTILVEPAVRPRAGHRSDNQPLPCVQQNLYFPAIPSGQAREVVPVACGRSMSGRGAGGWWPQLRSIMLALGVSLLAGVLLAGLASAAGAAVVWRVDPLASTTVAAGGTLSYRVQLTNVGDSTADATQVPITFSGSLPPGLTVSSVSEVFSSGGSAGWDCSSVIPGDSTFSCTTVSKTMAPWDLSTLAVDIAVAGDASGTLTSLFSVSGGDPSTGDPSSPVTTTPDPTTISSSSPPFGVDAFDNELFADASGAPSIQAGAHPYEVTTSIDFNTVTRPEPLKGSAWPVEPVKDVLVDLPPGLVGNPTGLAQCTVGQLSNGVALETLPLCPATSQVGVTLLHTLVGSGPFQGIQTALGPLPVYNMVPPPGVPARFGFNAAGSIVTLDARVRSSGDYGLSIDVKNVPEGLAFAGSTVTFWGVPADPSHDRERACPNSDAPSSSAGAPFCQSGAPLTAFLRNPTSCVPPEQGMTTHLRADSWVHPGAFVEARFVNHLLPGFPFTPAVWGPPAGMTGCERVPFLPGIDVRPVTPAAGAPSEFRVDLSLPQTDDPNSIAESDLRTAAVSLPAGVRVNPSSADGLAACTPAQIGLGSTDEPSCPDGSKIGTVRIITPLLRDPLLGSVFLASPHENPFGTLLAIYIVAEGSGTIIKLSGRVQADPITGQLTTTVDNNPQLPFNDVILDLKGGSRAPLTMPSACGDHTTQTEMIGWNGLPAVPQSTFTISGDGHGAPCPGPTFSPGFAASTESSTASHSSPFHARFTRTDVDQELGAVTVDMPAGLLGKIASATLCGEADAAHGTCGAASKIGDVTVGAGAGSNPFYITNGRAYLTGPYKGAPFGLSIVVPAVAGPFNLGDVNVRSALFVDKHDSSVRIVSDQLPTILQGIPLQVRDVRVDVNKPGFIINPTSCAEKTIASTISSTAGLVAHRSDRFQAADCRGLGFAPKMVLSVGGRGHTARNRPTPLSTRITMPTRDEANLRSVQVTLPDTINARLTVINDACTRAQFESDISKCAHAQAGTAVASTPLLRDPLRGNVYFVKNGHPLPDLFVALRGQVAFDLIGRITIPHSRFLRTTFATAPDVPVRAFTLKLFGDSRNGSIGAATNLCSKKGRNAKAQLDYIGQNGKTIHHAQRLVIHGCTKHTTHRRHRRR